jgi:hypothetical protein
MTALHTLPHDAGAMDMQWEMEGTGRFEGQSDAINVSRYFLVSYNLWRAINALRKICGEVELSNSNHRIIPAMATFSSRTNLAMPDNNA